MLIGLTGGIGSGKSLAGDFFKSKNIDVIAVSYTHLTLPTSNSV